MDLRISELPPLAAADLRAVDLLALADLSASETKKLSSKDFIQFGVTLIDDESIPSEKLMDVRHEDLAPALAAGEFLAGPAGAAGRILARRIIGTDLPPTTTTTLGALIIGAGLAADGMGLTAVQPATATTIGGVIIAADGGLETDATGILRHVTNRLPPGKISGITYDEHGHIEGVAALIGSDLPPAKERELGGVMIPADSGLAVTGTGELRHSFTIAAQTVSGVTIDPRGHVTALARLAGTDLPLATETLPGAVSVPGTGGLTIDGAGALRHAADAVNPGIYTKVTVGAFGHVLNGEVLQAADIPGLDASKITSGLLDAARLGSRVIGAGQLADYSTAFIQEREPTSPNFIGQLWLQESSAQLRVFNGNSWMPAGFGAVMLQNLRFAGLFDASTGMITAITPLGRESGFQTGTAVPAALSSHSGAYFVATADGINAAALPGTQFTAGDWILCLDEQQGWQRIDVTNGGGTSGGPGGVAGTLDQLTDVVVTNPRQGDVLTWDATKNTWINSGSSDPGFY